MAIVNTSTGEIAEIDPQETAAVSLLTRAVADLTAAVDAMPIETVVNLKAQIKTAETATRELGMSREAQELAAEAVRRAEWALGRAIRKGQEDGVIAKHGQTSSDLNSALDYGSRGEIYGANGTDGVLGLADSAPTQAELDAAIEAAKAEGNLSRANVVRKIKGVKGGETRDQRAVRVAELASQGYTSHQIAKDLGIGREAVVNIAHDFDITITADVVRGSVRRFNHNRVLDNVTEALEVAAISLRDVDPAQLDEEQAAERLDSLTASINALSKAVKKIKESFHD